MKATKETQQRAPSLNRRAPGQVFQHPHKVELAAAALRASVIEACASVQAAISSGDKDYLRALHLRAKQQQQTHDQAMLLYERHRNRFKTGRDIDPSKISPQLKLVTEGEWSEIFYVVRALWSMPYNKGYGRRLRFVIYDDHHEAVIGIIGLQSPPADLAVRDEIFACPRDRKLELVNATLDAYAVGAIPPYTYLLGGKLCAGLIATDTIRTAYWRQYAGKRTEMLEQGILQPLVGVTTTSAFGRSSQYNRLKYKERLLAKPIGYTRGYGMFHLEQVYPQACEYLKMVGLHTDGGYGNGPKVRWQNVTRALRGIGLPRTMLRHGVLREVFLYRFVEDFDKGMAGGQFGSTLNLPESDFAQYWRERWAVPRAARCPTWNSGDEDALIRKTLALLSD
jgi:Domain of unknown function (DUF4338)